ncbi:DUF5926 family protein, partial [Nocardia farcinica]|uniref:DUF5926 family protein n=1 Tax=Nocardia farcinica TaxID=37329 RepID=UPI00245767A5
HGLLVPVFDLDPERHPSEWVEPAREFGVRLADALAVDTPLTADVVTRHGVANRASRARASTPVTWVM